VKREEALGWLRERDRADDPQVLTKKGELLEKNGALEEALGCYQRAVWAGDPHALSKATWYQRAGANELGWAASLLEKTGRASEATDSGPVEPSMTVRWGVAGPGDCCCLTVKYWAFSVLGIYWANVEVPTCQKEALSPSQR
jgi:hypothetical protein